MISLEIFVFKIKMLLLTAHSNSDGDLHSLFFCVLFWIFLIFHANK